MCSVFFYFRYILQYENVFIGLNRRLAKSEFFTPVSRGAGKIIFARAVLKRGAVSLRQKSIIKVSRRAEAKLMKMNSVRFEISLVVKHLFYTIIILLQLYQILAQRRALQYTTQIHRCGRASSDDTCFFGFRLTCSESTSSSHTFDM